MGVGRIQIFLFLVSLAEDLVLKILFFMFVGFINHLTKKRVGSIRVSSPIHLLWEFIWLQLLVDWIGICINGLNYFLIARRKESSWREFAGWALNWSRSQSQKLQWKFQL